MDGDSITELFDLAHDVRRKDDAFCLRLASSDDLE